MWDDIFNHDYNLDDIEDDPIELCIRGHPVNRNTNWCCCECEREAMKRRKLYDILKRRKYQTDPNWYDRPPSPPNWQRGWDFFRSDDCFKDFKRVKPRKQKTISYDWNVLNLIPPKTQKEIKTQYRKLILKHHPDKGGDPKEFIKITKSYENLCVIC